MRGTTEVRGAVVASTLTSIAVFFPMVFVEGVAGQAFGDLGLAVVISLLASLAVALFLIPMLASRQGMQWAGAEPRRLHWREFASWRALRDDWRDLRRPRPRGRLRNALRWVAFPFVTIYLGLRFLVGAVLEAVGKLLLGLFFGLLWLGRRFVMPALGKVFGLLAYLPVRWTQVGLDRLHTGYPRGLRWALANPLAMLVVVVVCFAATGWTVMRLDTELLPEVHQGEFTVEVALPVGTPLEADRGHRLAGRAGDPRGEGQHRGRCC